MFGADVETPAVCIAWEAECSCGTVIHSPAMKSTIIAAKSAQP